MTINHKLLFLSLAAIPVHSYATEALGLLSTIEYKGTKGWIRWWYRSDDPRADEFRKNVHVYVPTVNDALGNYTYVNVGSVKDASVFNDQQAWENKIAEKNLDKDFFWTAKMSYCSGDEHNAPAVYAPKEQNFDCDEFYKMIEKHKKQ